MKLTAIQAHKSWLLPAILLLVVTCSIYAIVAWFAVKPFPWIGLIPGSLPLSMFIFVATPLLKKERQDSQGSDLGRD